MFVMVDYWIGIFYLGCLPLLCTALIIVNPSDPGPRQHLLGIHDSHHSAGRPGRRPAMS
eukprot:COSAG01_NODE_3690_length_5792_cov_45.557175_2_plen_59_part_00